MINKASPLNRDPNMKALKRREFINRGSTLSGLQGLGSVVLGSVYRRIRLDCQIPFQSRSQRLILTPRHTILAGGH